MFVLTACSEVADVCTEPSSRSRVITKPFTNTSRIVKLEIQVKVQVEARHGDSPKSKNFSYFLKNIISISLMILIFKKCLSCFWNCNVFLF